MDRHAPTTPTTPPPPAVLEALRSELRALYAERFRLAHAAAEAARGRFETPDGIGTIDPVYAADTAACRAVNRHLPTAMKRWLPGSHPDGRGDEPAVVDAIWVHRDRRYAIRFDHSYDFGDLEALTVQDITR